MSRFLLSFLLLFTSSLSFAQDIAGDTDASEATDAGARFTPMVKLGKVVYQGDSINYVQYNDLYIYADPIPAGMSRQSYNLLIRNVKKVLPYAKKVNGIIIETYETLATIPDEKGRQQHLSAVEKEIKDVYTPQMKKLTYAQGKLLIKLVDRECGSKSYNIVQAILGSVKAGFYQAFAWTFGASLKKGYDPNGADRITERIVRQVEAGQL